jgi:hypothetical protein
MKRALAVWSINLAIEYFIKETGASSSIFVNAQHLNTTLA